MTTFVAFARVEMRIAITKKSTQLFLGNIDERFLSVASYGQLMYLNVKNTTGISFLTYNGALPCHWDKYSLSETILLTDSWRTLK